MREREKDRDVKQIEMVQLNLWSWPSVSRAARK